MNKSYEHTQIGYLTISAIGSALLYVIYLVVDSFNWVALIVMLILGIALLLFATLKVTINDDWLEIRFGIGITRHKIFLEDIQLAKVVNYPWYYGWGLRLSWWSDWIYSV